MAKRGRDEAQDAGHLTKSFLNDFMVKTKLTGTPSAPTEMEVDVAKTRLKNEFNGTEVSADMPQQFADCVICNLSVSPNEAVLYCANCDRVDIIYHAACAHNTAALFQCYICKEFEIVPYVYGARAPSVSAVKVEEGGEIVPDHTVAFSAAFDAREGMKMHQCEACGPHVCTWTNVPTPDVPPEVYATVGLTLEFQSALDKMSEFVFHFHQALHLCIVTQNKDNMARIMMSMAKFVEHVDEDDMSYSNLLDLSMLKIFSIIEMDGDGVKTQNRIYDVEHEDFTFPVLLEFPFEDLKKRICNFIQKQRNLRKYDIHTYIADNLHMAPQKTDFSPAKIVTRVCDQWPDNVEMHDFILFHVKRYRIMKVGRQALDSAARS